MAQLTRLSSSLKMGIVGMANVGKSSTFNMLSKQSVPAENFPFCTIDPNQAVVKVPDPRFDYLCQIFKPKSQVFSTLSIIDIAGLVKGASEGYGLGNEFLAHIQAVDGLYQVVRAFEKEKIVHTEGTMDPIRDLQIISEELMAKDYQFVSKRVDEYSKKIKKYEANKNVSVEARDMVEQYKVLQKCDELLKKKQWVRYQKWTDLEQIQLRKIQLLTAKPSIYLINLSKEDHDAYVAKKQNKYAKPIEQWVSKNSPDSKIVYYSVENQDQQQLLDQMIIAGYDLLNLIRFFTVGSDEVRSWTIKKNIKAPQAAAAIHSDFEKGFVNAEVMSFDKFKKLGDNALDNYEKKFSKEGKDYIVKDGDIIHFKTKSFK
ncbi:unnamed protein product (macronuclear) [Paramecium tetraurelia]|uniref:Obg-like ATPase homolog n=1 Tax=Paramecium tetraurelia TaxID=5888 RepID=A0DJ80_PARTE|nr:uncharacterized protein GSPATT00017454001 [Paramecium tetraurelia]CAK83097.1 unnamed protein product [Paramecium tetraurelia]|eukprot:XP_001450494.1 hypothetical protein (macronuclear) [Paramecium tetraurelia strain d4-2]